MKALDKNLNCHKSIHTCSREVRVCILLCLYIRKGISIFFCSMSLCLRSMCLDVCMFMFTVLHMYACTHLLYTRVSYVLFTYSYTYTNTYIHTHTHTYIHVYIYTYIHKYIYINICMYIHIHTHIYAYT